MVDVAGAIGGVVRDGFCAWTNVGANLLDGASGLITGHSHPFNAPRMLNGLACERTPPAPPPLPTWGGQCDTLYDVTFYWVDDRGATPNVCFTTDTVIQGTVSNVQGPLRQIPWSREYLGPCPNDAEPYLVIGGIKDAEGDVVVEVRALNARDFSFSVTRSDGGSDDCGNAPPIPGPRPTDKPDYGPTINITGVNGDLNINVDHIGHVINNDGGVDVYVDVDINGVRGPGLVPINPRIPPVFKPTDVLPELPEWVGYDWNVKDLIALIKDVNYFLDEFEEFLEEDPFGDPPPTLRKAIKEVDVTITSYQGKGKTRWTFQDGRDIVVPYMALFAWVYDTPGGVQAVSEDIPIKLFKQRFVCPSELGAVGYIVRPEHGVEYTSRVHLWIDIESQSAIIRQ